MKKAAITIITLMVLTSMLAIGAGCGGSESVEVGPVEAWNKFVRNVQLQHYDEAWNEISARYQTAWPRQGRQITGESYDPFMDVEWDLIANRLENVAPVRDCEIKGDRAVLLYSPKDSTTVVPAALVKEDGEWRIDDIDTNTRVSD